VPGPETLPPEPRRSDSVPVLGLRGLATSALALPAVPAVAADRSPTSLVLAAVAVGVGGGAAWWTSRRSGPPRPLLAVLGALLVVVAGWLLPQADVSVITVLIGFGVGVGAGLGGGALGVLRRPEAAIGTAVGPASWTAWRSPGSACSLAPDLARVRRARCGWRRRWRRWRRSGRRSGWGRTRPR